MTGISGNCRESYTSRFVTRLTGSKCHDLWFVGERFSRYRAGKRGENAPSINTSDVMGAVVAIIILIRNLVIAGVLAWLGIEFAPDDNSDRSEPGPQSALILGHSLK
jgi:hypothetical protein